MVCVVFSHFYEPSSNPRYSITRKLNGLPSLSVVGYDPAAVAGGEYRRRALLPTCLFLRANSPPEHCHSHYQRAGTQYLPKSLEECRVSMQT